MSAIKLLGDNDNVLICGNYIGQDAGVGIYVAGSSHTKHVYASNVIEPEVAIHIDGATIDDLVIEGNSMVPTTYGVHVDTGGSSTGKISGNTIRGGTTSVFVNNASQLAITDNFCDEPDEHGILIDGMVDGVVSGNEIYRPGAATSNTFDGIRIVSGDDNLILGNKITPIPTVTRYGLSVAGGNNNAVFANYLGDSSDYATADSVDAGTGTIVAAAGGAIGGQFAY